MVVSTYEIISPASCTGGTASITTFIIIIINAIHAKVVHSAMMFNVADSGGRGSSREAVFDP